MAVSVLSKTRTKLQVEKTYEAIAGSLYFYDFNSCNQVIARMLGFNSSIKYLWTEGYNMMISLIRTPQQVHGWW